MPYGQHWKMGKREVQLFDEINLDSLNNLAGSGHIVEIDGLCWRDWLKCLNSFVQTVEVFILGGQCHACWLLSVLLVLLVYHEITYSISSISIVIK